MKSGPVDHYNYSTEWAQTWGENNSLKLVRLTSDQNHTHFPTQINILNQPVTFPLDRISKFDAFQQLLSTNYYWLVCIRTM